MITDEGKIVKAQAYAEHIEDLSYRKLNREGQIDHLRSELGLTSGAIGDRVSTSPSADAIPNAVIKLQDMIREYVAELSEYVDEIHRFTQYLAQLDRIEEKVLWLRYVGLCRWGQIADQLGYSQRQLYRIRDHALVALYGVMPEPWRSEAIPDAEEGD